MSSWGFTYVQATCAQCGIEFRKLATSKRLTCSHCRGVPQHGDRRRSKIWITTPRKEKE